MKTILKFAAVAAFVFTAGAAQADTVTVMSDDLSVVTGKDKFPISFSGGVGFTPTDDTIALEIGGMMCTFGSSTQGSVPKGCNYQVIITPSAMTAVPTEASDTCMKIEASCVPM